MNPLNQFSYLIVCGILVLGLAAWVALTGLSRRKLGVVGVTAFALVLVWAVLRPGPGDAQRAAPVELVIRETRTPVLVEFYSEYCVGCLAAETTLDSLEKELKGQVSIVRLDMTSALGQELSAQLNARFTPTFILFDVAGREIWRAVGTLDAGAVRDLLGKS